ncbi:MAG: hypothetical protein WCJ70_04050 [bacterium]
MIDTSRAIRTLVFKTKSDESAFVYVRGDTRRLLVITCAPESATPEQIHLMEQLYEKLPHLQSIDALEDLLSPFVDLSLSVLVHHGHKLLLGTVGTGGIYLKRRDTVLEVVSEGFCAEGAGEDGDTFVAVTDSFLDHVGGLEGLTYYLTHYQPEDVVEMMQTYDEGQTFGFGMALYGHEQIVVPPLVSPLPDTGVETAVDDDISLTGDGETLTVEEHISRAPQSTVVPVPRATRVKQRLSMAMLRCRLACAGILTKIRSLPLKKIAIIGIPTLALIVMAVRGGSSVRKLMTDSQKEYTSFATSVQSDLKAIEAEGFLDTSKATRLFDQLETKIDKSSEEFKPKYAPQLAELVASVTKKKEEMLKIQHPEIKEYFDMVVEQAAVTVTDVDIDGDKIYVLDGEHGIIYIIATPVPSYNKIASDKLKGATQVASSGGYTYALTKSEGIFLMDETKSHQVIAKDDKWGSLTDMKVFNSNLYLLDDTKKDIYKYVAADTESFRERVSYLADDAAVNFTGGTRLVIDGSVYISKLAGISSYRSGNRVDFKVDIPSSELKLTDFATAEESKDVAVLDGTHGVLYRVEKSGAFISQIPDAKLNGAIAVVASKDRYYVVKGSKVYEVMKN